MAKFFDLKRRPGDPKTLRGLDGENLSCSLWTSDQDGGLFGDTPRRISASWGWGRHE